MRNQHRGGEESESFEKIPERTIKAAGDAMKRRFLLVARACIPFDAADLCRSIACRKQMHKTEDNCDCENGEFWSHDRQLT
jgi:hypothetical protein